MADGRQSASITAGRQWGGGRTNTWGVTGAKALAGPPPTFSAYSDTICLISAEQRPTIWPTELAVRRLCNHREGVFSRLCTAKPEHSQYYSKIGIIPRGKNNLAFTRAQQGRVKINLRMNIKPPSSLLSHLADRVRFFRPMGIFGKSFLTIHTPSQGLYS